MKIVQTKLLVKVTKNNEVTSIFTVEPKEKSILKTFYYIIKPLSASRTLRTQPIKNPNPYTTPSSLPRIIQKDVRSDYMLPLSLQVSYPWQTKLCLCHSDFDGLFSYNSSISSKSMALKTGI